MKALYQLTVDILFLINLSDEIQRPIALPAVILGDNNPTVQLSSSLSSRIKRSKHFLMLINFIRHQVSMGLIAVQKVASADNIADVLTKALPWRDLPRRLPASSVSRKRILIHEFAKIDLATKVLINIIHKIKYALPILPARSFLSRFGRESPKHP